MFDDADPMMLLIMMMIHQCHEGINRLVEHKVKYDFRKVSN